MTSRSSFAPSRAASALSADFTRVPRVSRDLGFAAWETLELLSRTPDFDRYSARPRGRDDAPAFVLATPNGERADRFFDAAAIERERFLGYIANPGLYPSFDVVRPSRSSRGCVVYPRLAGRSLDSALRSGATFSPRAVDAIVTRLASALDALHRRDWSFGELSPDRILLSTPLSPNALPLATLADYSGARRFALQSLLLDDPFADSFDPSNRLEPNAFFDPDATPERDFASLRALSNRLAGRSSEPVSPNLRVFHVERAA